MRAQIANLQSTKLNAGGEGRNKDERHASTHVLRVARFGLHSHHVREGSAHTRREDDTDDGYGPDHDLDDLKLQNSAQDGGLRPRRRRAEAGEEYEMHRFFQKSRGGRQCPMFARKARGC